MERPRGGCDAEDLIVTAAEHAISWTVWLRAVNRRRIRPCIGKSLIHFSDNGRRVTKAHRKSRREALRLLVTAAAFSIAELSPGETGTAIHTVPGPIPSSSWGFTLPHEHVMVDFAGAQKTGRDRWNPDEVVARMQPYLHAAKQRGVRGFIDCTPAYVGRDPRILKKLAQNTGLHILTNTGASTQIPNRPMSR